MEPALAAVRAEHPPVGAGPLEELDLVALVELADLGGAELVGGVEEANDAVPDDPPLVALDRGARAPLSKLMWAATRRSGSGRLAGLPGRTGRRQRGMPASAASIGRDVAAHGPRRAPRPPGTPAWPRAACAWRTSSGAGGSSSRRFLPKIANAKAIAVAVVVPTSIGRAVVVVGRRWMPSTSRASRQGAPAAGAAERADAAATASAAAGPGAAGRAVGRSATGRAVVDRARDGPGRGRSADPSCCPDRRPIAGAAGARGVVAAPRPGGRAARVRRRDRSAGRRVRRCRRRPGRSAGRSARATRPPESPVPGPTDSPFDARRRRRAGVPPPGAVVPPGVDRIAGGRRRIATRVGAGVDRRRRRAWGRAAASASGSGVGVGFGVGVGSGFGVGFGVGVGVGSGALIVTVPASRCDRNFRVSAASNEIVVRPDRQLRRPVHDDAALPVARRRSSRGRRRRSRR